LQIARPWGEPGRRVPGPLYLQPHNFYHLLHRKQMVFLCLICGARLAARSHGFYLKNQIVMQKKMRAIY